MLVKCIRNNSDDLSENDRQYLSNFIHIDKHETFLKIGDIFIVYGITFWKTHPWYYVYEEPTDTYPIPQPHHYFETIDNRFDPSWQLTTEILDDGKATNEILPREWAKDMFFYENLLDEDSQAISLMEAIKARFEEGLEKVNSQSE